jgi:hypothetical protein
VLNCNNGSIKQIIRKTRNDNLWEWSVSARARNLPISETVVGNGGSELAKMLQKSEFWASNG